MTSSSNRRHQIPSIFDLFPLLSIIYDHTLLLQLFASLLPFFISSSTTFSFCFSFFNFFLFLFLLLYFFLFLSLLLDLNLVFCWTWTHFIGTHVLTLFILLLFSSICLVCVRSFDCCIFVGRVPHNAYWLYIVLYFKF